ncbi:MAG TPA: hypothetical protein PKI19_10905 [Elusimicrobiales bacterium]|nr:hypothetical protein [Elusimicrobiales bacterium]
MKPVLLTLLLPFLYGSCRGLSLKLRSGAEIDAEVARIDAASVLLKDGRKHPRADVS